MIHRAPHSSGKSGLKRGGVGRRGNGLGNGLDYDVLVEVVPKCEGTLSQPPTRSTPDQFFLRVFFD